MSSEAPGGLVQRRFAYAELPQIFASPEGGSRQVPCWGSPQKGSSSSSSRIFKTGTRQPPSNPKPSQQRRLPFPAPGDVVVAPRGFLGNGPSNGAAWGRGGGESMEQLEAARATTQDSLGRETTDLGVGDPNNGLTRARNPVTAPTWGWYRGGGQGGTGVTGAGGPPAPLSPPPQACPSYPCRSGPCSWPSRGSSP